MGDKPKAKTAVLMTPYQFAKNHPELNLRTQAVYQHCLKQAAPHTREKGGRIMINEAEFLSWFTKRSADRQQKAAARKLTKSK